MTILPYSNRIKTEFEQQPSANFENPVTGPWQLMPEDPADTELSNLLPHLFSLFSIKELEQSAHVYKNWRVLSPRIAASEDSQQKQDLAKILSGTPWEASHKAVAAYHVNHLSEAQFVFIAESHEQRHSEINAPVINAIASDEIATNGCIALFLECYTSMKAIESPSEREKIEKQYLIKKEIMDKIQLFGWDLDEKICEEKEKAVSELKKEGESNLSQNEFTLLKDSIKEHQAILDSLTPELSSSIDQLIKGTIHDISGASIWKSCSKMQEEDNEKWRLIRSSLRHLIGRRKDVQFLHGTMPKRTEEATCTVQKTAQLQKEKQLPPKAIFIMGRAHLQEGWVPDSHNPQSEAWSLQTFYQEISQHKAVILFPKS